MVGCRERGVEEAWLCPGEVQVCLADGLEPESRPRRCVRPRAHLVHACRHTLSEFSDRRVAYRREQGVPVGEVPVGGVGNDSDHACHLAQHDRVRTACSGELDAGLDQGGSDRSAGPPSGAAKPITRLRVTHLTKSLVDSVHKGDIVDSVHNGRNDTMNYNKPASPTASKSNVGQAARFDQTASDQPGAGNVEAALARNRAFAAAGGHEGAVVFPTLGLFVITCMDPRVDPAHFLGLELSDAIVVRNIGGRVTPEVINDVAFVSQIAENAMPDGPLFDVAVIHHTQCAAGALADDLFRQSYAERTGVEESALRAHAILDPAATVTGDVERLRSAPAISPRVSVSGYVYDVVTGLVQTIVPAGARDVSAG